MTKNEADAKFEADMAKYEAEKRQWQAKIEAQKKEEARKQAEHKARQEQAQKALADFEARNRMFERVFAEQQRQQREYEALQARHRKCLAGDRQACDDIRSGQPALEEEVEMAENAAIKNESADAGEASTRTDANRCISAPEMSQNVDGFKGNTQAKVVNGCSEKVNIRICLMRTSGKWDCGVKSFVEPDGYMRYWTKNATGEVFVDAVTSASRKGTAMPPGM